MDRATLSSRLKATIVQRHGSVSSLVSPKRSRSSGCFFDSKLRRVSIVHVGGSSPTRRTWTGPAYVWTQKLSHPGRSAVVSFADPPSSFLPMEGFARAAHAQATRHGWEGIARAAHAQATREGEGGEHSRGGSLYLVSFGGAQQQKSLGASCGPRPRMRTTTGTARATTHANHGTASH